VIFQGKGGKRRRRTAETETVSRQGLIGVDIFYRKEEEGEGEQNSIDCRPFCVPMTASFPFSG